MKEGVACRKECLVSLYAFSEWLNGKPIIDSAVIDAVAYLGELSNLEKKAEEELGKGNESILIFDGKKYLLIVEKNIGTLEEEASLSPLKVITDKEFMFIYPNTINGSTGQYSKVIKMVRRKEIDGNGQDISTFQVNSNP